MCTSTTTNLVGFFMQKRYILTGYFDNMNYGHICQEIAESNNFDTMQTLLENLMSFDLTMDIYDSELDNIILSTTNYAPPKQK